MQNKMSRQLFLDYYRIGLQVRSKPVEDITYNKMLKLIKHFPSVLFTQIVWAEPYESIANHFKDDIVVDAGMQSTNILSRSHVQLAKCFALKDKNTLLFAILDSWFPLFLPPTLTVFEMDKESDRDGWIVVEKSRI